MKTEKNILAAFLLNISFSLFELLGGIFIRSVSIISDAIHDFGDAISIGISYFLEKKSKKKPDDKYTYGYARYSVMGSLITTIILIVGSILVIYNAIMRIIKPVEINYNGMIIFAIFGVIVNYMAAYFTKEGDSLNGKAVNLHMLEDVLGWLVVLIGAIVMRFTDIRIIDPILSILVAIFIFKNAFANLKIIIDLFLEKTPVGINVKEIKEHILSIKGVKDIHHIHIWTIDGINPIATMHIVTDNKDLIKIKEKVKHELNEHGINHITIQFEDENCDELECNMEVGKRCYHHHHH